MSGLTALSWLLGSKGGRITAVAILSVALAGLVLAAAFGRGAAAERAARAAATLDAIRRKVAIDDEIARLDPAARRQRLRRWARG